MVWRRRTRLSRTASLYIWVMQFLLGQPTQVIIIIHKVM